MARGPRLLSQVHGRRAHAADDSQPRADRAHRGALSAALPERDRLAQPARTAGTGAAAPRRRQMAGRRSRARERADGQGRRRSSAARRRRARDGALPDQAPPAHVAGRLPPRHRGSGDRQGLLGLHWHRGALEDALPDDAGRCRGGQSGNADAVERGAALAALRGYLQPSHAAVRRRADRAQSGGSRRAPAAATGRSVAARDHEIPRGAAATLSAAVSP